jgi:hypothetical protein
VAPYGSSRTTAGTRTIQHEISAIVPSPGYPRPRIPSASTLRAAEKNDPISRTCATGTAATNSLPKKNPMNIEATSARPATIAPDTAEPMRKYFHILRRASRSSGLAAIRGYAMYPTLVAAARGRFVNACATTYSPRATGFKTSPTTAWSARNASIGDSDPKRLLRPKPVMVRRDGIGPSGTDLGRPRTATPRASRPPRKFAPAQIVMTTTMFARPTTNARTTNAAYAVVGTALKMLNAVNLCCPRRIASPYPYAKSPGVRRREIAAATWTRRGSSATIGMSTAM